MLNKTLEISPQLQIEAMFMKHYKEWCLIAYSYIENMIEAEDMVQDVFVKVLNRKRDTEILDLKNYISIAVRNTSLKTIQRTKKTEKIKDYALASLAPSHEDYLIDIEYKAEIQKAIKVLPKQSKKVFELCVLEGVKYQNAADTLGISINTVKFHLKKAYKILRKELRNTHL